MAPSSSSSAVVSSVGSSARWPVSERNTSSRLGRRSPRLRPLYYGLAAIVATSRVHVQVHHASDVLAGAVVGTTYARVADRWVPTRRP